MKYLLIIILFPFILYSQTEPAQIKFLYKGDSTYISSSHEDFKPDKFILGWQWATQKKMSSAMRANQAHATTV